MNHDPTSLLLEAGAITSMGIGIAMTFGFIMLIAYGAALFAVDVVIDALSSPPANPLPSDPFSQVEK